MQTIAFFGLGTMGIPMVKNLLAAGYPVRVTVHNGHRQGPEEVAAQGALIADSLEAAVGDADVIISIVPDDAAVADVYLNEAMHQAVKPGAIIIEMTSCSAAAVQAVQAYYQDKQVQVIDAPVTGAKQGAEQGTLTIMGAGDPQAFETVRPILQAMGRKIYHLGQLGNGKIVKAATNLMGAVNLAVVGEICRLTKAQGLAPAQFLEVAQDSAGGSTQLNRNFMKMAEENYNCTFALKLLRKDMALALQMAPDLNLPVSQCAYQLYQQASPYDNEDCCAIIKVGHN